MARDPTTAVSYANEAAYDSDGDGASSRASTSASGVVLGFDDGLLLGEESGAEQSYADERNLQVSRIGGRPSFPGPTVPPFRLSKCPMCSHSMLLLLQIHAPLIDDQVKLLPDRSNRYREEFDRILYVFACVRKGCNGVKCLRAARRNPEWAREGRQRRGREVIARQAEDKAKAASKAANPFASASTSAINPFLNTNNPFSGGEPGLGSAIFGSSQALPAEETQSPDEPASIELSPQEDAHSTQAMFWSPGEDDILRIPPRYLTSSYEQIFATNTSRQARLEQQLESMGLGDERPAQHKGGRIVKNANSAPGRKGTDSNTSGQDVGWSTEAYEVMRISGVEEVFLAFQERLEASNAADQVVRYEFGGTPLPFSANSGPFKQLYSAQSGPISTTIGRDHSASSATSFGAAGMRKYDTSCRQVSNCQHCGSARTFELQIMPHLVSIVEKSLNSATPKSKEQQELSWATVWCFVCSADCLDSNGSGGSDNLDLFGWREEVALVETED